MGRDGSSACSARQQLADLGESLRTCAGTGAGRRVPYRQGSGWFGARGTSSTLKRWTPSECVLSDFDATQLRSAFESRRLTHTVEDISASSINHLQAAGASAGCLANAAFLARFSGRPLGKSGEVPLFMPNTPKWEEASPENSFYSISWAALKRQAGRAVARGRASAAVPQMVGREGLKAAPGWPHACAGWAAAKLGLSSPWACYPRHRSSDFQGPCECRCRRAGQRRAARTAVSARAVRCADCPIIERIEFIFRRGLGSFVVWAWLCLAI